MVSIIGQTVFFFSYVWHKHGLQTVKDLFVGYFGADIDCGRINVRENTKIRRLDGHFLLPSPFHFLFHLTA